MTQRRNDQRQQQQSQGSQGQQGDQSSSRQQQQFDTSTRQQGGGGEGSFADQIQPHQEVVDQNGAFVGTVDHVDGDRIKLTRTSSGDGKHHYIALDQVAGIESGKIRLQGRGDASFGQEATN